MDIRHAEQADLPILLDIYNHYVVHTPVTFDIEPRTLAQRRAWFDEFSRTGRHQCFVAVIDSKPIGYACSHRFKEKAAYDPTISTSIYLAPTVVRQGIGRALYAALFEALKDEDIHRAYGGITLPNEGSVGLHQAMGFRHIGTETQVGRKFDRFWDVALYERQMP